MLCNFIATHLKRIISWHWDHRTIQTQKSGPLTLRREIGVYSLTTEDDFQESGLYMHLLWKTALETYTRPAERILLLGIGCGDALMLLRKKFPQAQVTAIDWDEEIIRVGKEINGHRWPKHLTILEGDARELVPTLTNAFDLVLVDLFVRREIPMFVGEPKFQAELRDKMAPGGMVYVNIYNSVELLPSWTATFGNGKTVVFQKSTVGVFEK